MEKNTTSYVYNRGYVAIIQRVSSVAPMLVIVERGGAI